MAITGWSRLPTIESTTKLAGRNNAYLAIAERRYGDQEEANNADR
jgi:hypothetical protein